MALWMFKICDHQRTAHDCDACRYTFQLEYLGEAVPCANVLCNKVQTVTIDHKVRQNKAAPFPLNVPELEQ